VAADVIADAQTRVTVDADQPGLESRIAFHIGQRKIYRLEIAVPGDLRLPEVVLPAAGQWTIEKQDKRSVLRVNLAQGIEGEAALILRGKLAALDARREMPLPQLDVLGVKRQEGVIAVQADPAFDVDARDLRDCRKTDLDRANAWLDAPLRAATREALYYSGGAAAGRLRLVARRPEIACDTITNVKVTDSAIEETILLDYEIRNAGIRELTFLLPASMCDAQITTPLMRRRPTNEPLDAKREDSPRRIRVELQGNPMNNLRVRVQNDRLLPSGTSSCTAPLPSFEAAGGEAVGFVRRQYVVLETANRDQLIVALKGLEALSDRQQQWKDLCQRLDVQSLDRAYLVKPGTPAPSLSFHLEPLKDLQTAGARIDLAETTMVVDASGAFRAKVEFTLDNSSEQLIEVELPEQTELWTVYVAGEPVKPAKLPGAVNARHVLLPVLKTAKGDLSYAVVLKYGGKLPPLSAVSAVRFPLVHSVKSYPSGTPIGIQRSQLQLYLPRSHQWYDFDKSMHLVDEAEQNAVRVSVLNEQGRRLLETNNLSNLLGDWGVQAEKAQAIAGGGENRSLQTAIQQNKDILQRARQLLDQPARDIQSRQGKELFDNRKRLNELYQKQIVKNGVGTLNLGGANSYSGGTTVSAGTLALQNGAEFNSTWIDRNDLKGGQFGGAGGVLNLNGNQINIGNGNALAQSTEVNAQPAQGGAQANQGGYFGTISSQSGQQPALTKTGNGLLVLSYSNAATFGRVRIAGGAIDLSHGQEVSGPGQLAGAAPAAAGEKAQAALFDTADRGAQPGAGALPVVPAGLASLDFQLPMNNELYQLYRFTTPREEAEMTARTISAGAVARLHLLAGIAAAVVLLWAAFRLIDRGALDWLRHPLGATLLLVVGVAMICGGILPVFASAAIIFAVWSLIARLVRHYRPAAAQ